MRQPRVSDPTWPACFKTGELGDAVTAAPATPATPASSDIAGTPATSSPISPAPVTVAPDTPAPVTSRRIPTPSSYVYGVLHPSPKPGAISDTASVTAASVKATSEQQPVVNVVRDRPVTPHSDNVGLFAAAALGEAPINGRELTTTELFLQWEGHQRPTWSAPRSWSGW
jgi:hypothetical protein